MATSKTTKKSRLDAAVIETKKGDFQRLLEHAQENLMLYLAGIGFFALCLIAGSLYTLNEQLVVEDKVTQYATALETTDPALQAAELERLATGSDSWSVEALYMMAESSVRAREFAKAEEGFKRVVAEAPDSEFAPRAADGLAFLAENSGDYEGALKGYQEVYWRWSGTFTGRRQPFNIGRVLESLERFEEAVRSYEDQVAGFPGSRVALQATAALDRLRGEHPALFPEVPVVEVGGDAGAAS